MDPDSYYEDPALRERIGNVRAPIEELQKRGILVDRDEDGTVRSRKVAQCA